MTKTVQSVGIRCHMRQLPRVGRVYAQKCSFKLLHMHHYSLATLRHLPPRSVASTHDRPLLNSGCSTPKLAWNTCRSAYTGSKLMDMVPAWLDPQKNVGQKSQWLQKRCEISTKSTLT